jgi:hypothetical protein
MCCAEVGCSVQFDCHVEADKALQGASKGAFMAGGVTMKGGPIHANYAKQVVLPYGNVANRSGSVVASLEQGPVRDPIDNGGLKALDYGCTMDYKAGATK